MPACVGGQLQQGQLVRVSEESCARRVKKLVITSVSVRPSTPTASTRAGRCTCPCAGSNATTNVCGNRVRSRSIAWGGRRTSVRVACTKASSCAVVAARGQQLVEGAAQTVVSRRGTGAGDELDRAEALLVEIEQPAALDVVGLAERVGERGSGVADPLAQGVPAMQMSERDVVDTVERAEPDLGHSADRDVSLAVRGCGAGDEGMCHHHRSGASWPGGEVARGRASSPRPSRAGGCVQAASIARGRPRARDRAGRRSRRRRARRGSAAGCRPDRGRCAGGLPPRRSGQRRNRAVGAESWLPLVRTIRTPVETSRRSASLASSIASIGGSARS